MFLRKTILIMWILTMYLHAHAQDACKNIFSGRVLDENNQPVSGAGVSLSTYKGTLSDTSGYFRFTEVCSGNYTVTVQYHGYHDVSIAIELHTSMDRIIRLSEKITSLKEVVIQHHDDAGTEHAVNFAQVDRQKLAELAGKSLGESLREISGVNSMQTGPGIFKPVIHGMHSQRILVLNHGIRQESQQWGAEHALEIDPFMASSIVVIKDAAAIKYGTDALGGVILVNPPILPEQHTLGGTINTVFQTNGRSATVSAMLEGGIPKHAGWGWRVQGTTKRTGDFSTPDHSLTNTGIKEMNYSVATGYHRDKVGFDFFFSHFQTDIGILKGTAIANIDDLAAAMERSTPAYTEKFSYYIDEPRQEVIHNLAKLNGHVTNEKGEWRFQYGFQNNNRREFDMRTGGLSKVPTLDLQLNTHTLDVEWETAHTQKRTITMGVSGMYQSNRNIYGTQRIPFIPNFTTASAGTFVISKIYAGTWTFDVGARYDYRNFAVKGFDYTNTYFEDNVAFNNISATLGATKQWNAIHSFSVNVASTWRPPHVAELYSLGTHQSAASIEYGLLITDSSEVRRIGDVNFKTERTVKLVTTYQWKKEHVVLSVSPYANLVANYIFLRPRGVRRNLNGFYPYFHYDQTDALFMGADISATFHFGNYFTVLPQASLLRVSDIKNNDVFGFIPANRYEITFRFDKPFRDRSRNVYAEVRTKYTAQQNRAPRVVSVNEIKKAQEEGLDLFGEDDSNFDFTAAPKGYFLTAVAVGLSVNTSKVRYDFRVAADNVFNERYREYTNRFRYYADDMGRNIIVSLKCSF